MGNSPRIACGAIVGEKPTRPRSPGVTTGANGAYAVAAPAFAHTPVLSGDSIENGKRDRLFSIQSASAAGVHELYAAPHKRPGSATGLAAPDTHRPDCPERD